MFVYGRGGHTRAVVALLASLLTLLLSPSLSHEAAAARLTLASLAPPTVVGTGFQPGERIETSLQVRGRTFRVRSTARQNGRFTARFSPLIAIEPCSGRIVLIARGNRGTTATASRACHPADPAP